MPASLIKLLLLDADAEAASRLRAQLRVTDLSVDLRHLAGDDEARLLAELDTFQPDLVVSERDLPGFSGLRALTLVKRRGPIPVLFLSAQVDDAFASQVLRAGAADCVRKSEPLRLAASVEIALRRARERRVQVRIERELIQARRYESLPMLLSALAHDLRNVLQPLMFTGVVLKRSEDPALQRLQETLDNTTQKGLDIVSSMMAFCKTDVPEDDLNVQALLRSLRLLLPKKATRGVEVSFDSSLGVVACRVNQAEIEQCLLTLGLNAIHAMPQGGTLRFAVDQARLDAAAQAEGGPLPSGDCVRLSVEDSAPRSLADDDLGLTLCRTVALQLRGAVRTSARSGDGTCVELYLPLRAAESTLEMPRVPQSVMFATRDDGAAHSLAKAGAPVGFDVSRVADSTTAAAYLERNRLPDLAIIDTDLPRLEDARVFSLLRQRRFAGSVILLASPGADMDHDTSSGSVKLMTKPVDDDSLLAALRDCIGQPSPSASAPAP